MNTKLLRVIAILVIFLLLLCLSIYLLHRTFFQRLDFKDISEICLYSNYSYDSETFLNTPLSEEDALSVYNLLRQLPLKRIYATTIDGFYPINTQMFLIRLTDGRSIQLGVTASKVVINGRMMFTGDYTVGTELQNLHFTLNPVYFPRPEQP